MAVEAIRAPSSVQPTRRDLRSAIVACARTASSAGHRRTCEVVWRAVHPRFSDDTLQARWTGVLRTAPTVVEPDVPAQLDLQGSIGIAFGLLRPADREILVLVAWDGFAVDQLAVALSIARRQPLRSGCIALGVASPTPCCR
jgi:hypothetical protein